MPEKWPTMVPCRHLLCNPDYVTRWNDWLLPIWKYLHTERGLEPIINAFWFDKNAIRKPRSFHLIHISAYIHMRQNQLTSPSPFLKNKYREPESEPSQVSIKLFTAATMLSILTMFTFPPTCLLRRPTHPFCEHKQMNPSLLTLLEFISSVRSSNSHPDLLVIQQHQPLFQITPVLNTGLSLSEPLQLYKGYNAI